jgi:uncharacterized membrane protein
MNMPDCGFQFFHHAFFQRAGVAFALAVFAIKADVFWPYFTGGVLLVIGLVKIIRDELPHRRGLDKILPFGRLCFAIPMGIFGTDHFVFTAGIAGIVPSWMPWHVFVTYLVGVCLIAAALSIILGRYSKLAATLMGIMFVLFVALLHIPNIVATHGSRLFCSIGLRDIAFGGGAFALAGGLSTREAGPAAADGVALWMVTFGRLIVGIAALVFGVEDILHPTLVPGVPLDNITPTWVPGHLFWAYVTGVVLVACGACIVVNRKARLAATYLGIMILVLMPFVFVPILVANRSNVGEGLNLIADTLAFGGAALVLADALP